jgi:hypothetical protein
MDIDKPVKNSNVWSSIVNDQESDTDTELKHDEPDNDYCRATRVDGNPCKALRYKNELYCYSHLLSQKTRPRGRPKKLVAVAAPATTTIGVVAAPQVAPVGSSFSGSLMSENSGRCAHRSESVNDDLVLKLTDRLKMKIDLIDNETKLLLKLLL